ncbi:MAG TPA: tetratricopeptide repeat protein [Bryobacteraceae bacterium]|jgi:TolA-binding protein|nr:tetratricopeptide repeat protein [Bryobacteraceae bacterium]
MNASRLLLVSIAFAPAVLLGQKHDELVSIQRDVAQLEDQVKQIQKALDDKTAALTALLQQSIDASNKSAAALAAMQHSLDQKLAEQQTKLVAPVATLGTKVDEMSGDLRSVATNVAELVRHMNDMDAKVKDLSDAVRSIQTPVPPPPPAGGSATATQTTDAPPAGWSAELAYQNAYRDYQGKKDDLALEEFGQYVKYAPQSENAPNAQYYVGQIYYRNQQWSDAAKAFDAVLEMYPKNPKTPEAQYMKACALMNDKQKTAAGKEFKNFLAAYPDNPRAHDAHVHLQELGLETPKRRKD